MATPLFVLSSPRSGSTLLQRVLNTYDDVLLCGEHGGFLRPMSLAWFRLQEDQSIGGYVFPANAKAPVRSREDIRQKKDPAHWQAWLNFFSEEDARRHFRQVVESFFRNPLMGDDHVWGFKEVRYGAGDRVVEFLADLFPEAIFVFLSRSVYDNIASQIKAFRNPSRLRRTLPMRGFRNACRYWRAQNSSLREWHESGRLRSFWVRFEDLAGSVEALGPLVGALGKSIGPAQRSVLEMEEGRGGAFGDRSVHARWKTISFPQLIAARLIAGELNDRLGHPSPGRAASVPLRRRVA